MPIIKYEKGDVLKTQIPFIAHGVNCQGVMGAGVAKAIAAKWPESETKYKEFCWKTNQPENLMGKSFATYEKEDKKFLFHLFTQKDFGLQERKVDYGALARSFSELNNTLKTMRDFDEHMEKEMTGVATKIDTPVVAIPKIGSGLGGGEWDLIVEIINGCTPDIAVVVYEL